MRGYNRPEEEVEKVKPSFTKDRPIYLASPYSDPSSDIRRARFEAVCRVAGHLMNEGLIVYSPIANDLGLPISYIEGLPRE